MKQIVVAILIITSFVLFSGVSSVVEAHGKNHHKNHKQNNKHHKHDKKPQIKDVIVLPCKSTSCGGITTIKVVGSGFTVNTRIELVGSGVTGSYVGGNGSTKILTDFINLPSGVYDLRVYSITGDTKTVIKKSAVAI